jgi:phage I-like protein
MKSTAAQIFRADILPLADAATPPVEITIPFGRLEYTKGDARGAVVVDDAFADAVIADFDRRGKEIVIDYEHATLSGDPAPAAGWIDSVTKGAAGIVCRVKSWTDKAGAFLAAREYRYFSPVIYRPEGKPGLHSFALTNHPALHGLPPLVAVDSQTHEKETPRMELEIQELAKRLEVAPLALADGNPDVKGTLAGIMSKVEEMMQALYNLRAFLTLHDAPSLDGVTAKIKSAAEAVALHDAEKAVAQAFADGKLVEAQRGWALGFAKTTPQAFADFAATAPRVAPAAVPPLKEEPTNGTLALSDAQKKILKNSGLTPEDVTPNTNKGK